MLFGFFRAIIVFFTLALTVLSVFALTGSYANKSYLTGTYLIDVQLQHLNLSKILNATAFGSKRDLNGFAPRDDFTELPTRTLVESNPKRELGDLAGTASSLLSEVATNTGLVASVTSELAGNSAIASVTGNSQVQSLVGAATSAAAAVATGASVPDEINGLLNNVESVINDIIDRFSYSELGLADVYSVSFWGYCRGNVSEDAKSITDLGKLSDAFDNSKTNITWCLKPTPAFKFDPLEIIKHELNNSIDGVVDGSGLPVQLTNSAKLELKVLVDNISYENLDLPGSIELYLNTLHGVTTASFIIMLVVCCLGFISTVLQLLAFCCSPNNCCLSFLNFLLLFVTFVLSIVSGGLATGCYMYVRKVVNENTSDYGVRSYLSMNFYAFAWSAAVAGLLSVIFHLLGHCVGMFSTGRRRYRAVGPPPGPPPPEAAYEHKSMSSSD